VMAEYFATMRQFLETQERVLNAFMAGGAQPAALPRGIPAAAPAPRRPAAVAPAARVAPAPVPVAVPAPAPAPVAAAPAPSPAPVVAGASVAAAAPAPAAASRVDGDRIRELLLSIVEERTGYPSDMVGLEQNLEADLGIDSIKRVEIVGALLQS